MESDGEEEIDPGQLHREKRNFIAKKTKQLKKDLKYGFKLSDLDSKITKADLGTLVNRLKKQKANPPEEPKVRKCNFLATAKLQDYKIPQEKMNKLFLDDFYRCKHRDAMRKMDKE